MQAVLRRNKQDETKGKREQHILFKREVYLNTLLEVINEKYAANIKLDIAIREYPEQIGNECVQMSLLNLIVVLRDVDPNEIVSPHYARIYRREILSELLQETENGRRILTIHDGDIASVFGSLKAREKLRIKIDKMFEARNKIAACNEITKNYQVFLMTQTTGTGI